MDNVTINLVMWIIVCPAALVIAAFVARSAIRYYNKTKSADDMRRAAEESRINREKIWKG